MDFLCRSWGGINLETGKVYSISLPLVWQCLDHPAASPFSISSARSLLNLPSLESRREQRFESLLQQVISTPSSSLHLLLASCKTSCRSLRSACPIVLPSISSNHGHRRFTTMAVQRLKRITPYSLSSWIFVFLCMPWLIVISQYQLGMPRFSFCCSSRVR